MNIQAAYTMFLFFFMQFILDHIKFNFPLSNLS